MNVIEVKNLVKNYDKLRAVDGVSFHVEEGEIFGLLGPNGAGKTTTLEILEGLKDKDSGTVKIIKKEEIGIVLQNNGFFPELTLLELLEMFAGFYPPSPKASADKPLINELVERFDLGKIINRRYAELSGGQRQRFVLALALLHKPKLVILDEPTVGLDPAVRQNFWETILKLREEGLSILLTTHYMEEAEIVSDRVAIIDHGRIIACDRPVKLINSLGIVSKVSFMSNKTVKLGDLEKLPGIISVRRDRYSYELETEAPEKSLRELLEWEKNFKGRIFNLQVQQATLDDVFLKLTGHHLRE
ncbi:MAG: ABC transporter ATP-binding protein [bacterium]|nr:ABC transporter ATP-binding protein [bacterium]